MKFLSDILIKAGLIQESSNAYSTGGYSLLVRNSTSGRFETIPSDSLLPSQSGNAGRFLKTNGTVASWSNILVSDVAGAVSSLSGEVTTTGVGNLSVTLSNSAVVSKVLTGLSVGGGAIVQTDSILTAFGKLQAQINSLSGGSTYKGTWNATTNTPAITSSVGTSGDYYIVSVAGTTSINGINAWDVGDWIIFDGTVWQKVDNTDSVTSVNGFTGAVNLSTTNITEGTNLYYTDTRARAAISLTTTGSSGSATYASGVLNVPTYTLLGLGGVPTTTTLSINGTSLDLSTSRSWSVGTVTSVNASVPTGFSVGAPVTSSGNIGITFSAGYSLPTIAKQTEWDTAYTLSLGAALTKTDDTNVTLTLGGSPATSVLRATSLALGWTGQLAVSRGGTGSSTITGVVIGNGAAAMTGLVGSASQILRRNSANTAYEFFTPNFTTGSGTANNLAKWTSANSIGDSQIIDSGTNVGIGVSPTSKLTVSGSVEVQGAITGLIKTGAAQTFNIGMLSTAFSPVGAYMAFYGNNTSTADVRGGVEFTFSTQNSGQGGFNVLGFDGSITRQYLKISRNGNLILENDGTFADDTNRLQVIGNSKLLGDVLINTGTQIPTPTTGSYGHSLQVLANASGGMIVSTDDDSSAIGIVNSASANKTWDISPFGNDLVINESGLAPRLKFKAGGNIEAPVLSGTGTRMVVADAAGVLSTQAIPTGSITGTGVADRVAFWSGASSLTNSANLIWSSSTSSLGVGISPTSRVHISGGGSDETTTSLTVQNASASVALKVADSGNVYLGAGSWLKVQASSARYIYKNDATDGIFSISSCSSLGTTINMYGATHASKPKTIEIGASYAPTSGTITYNALEIASNIDQTGSANATTRGLYINPVLNNTISQNNWRSIVWSNNTGYGLLGTGTAQNLLNGKLRVEVTVPSASHSSIANTISIFGAQVLNIPAANIGTSGVVYAAGTSANYMRFNGNTTMDGDALFAGKVVINSVQFDTTGTITMANSGAGGARALSGLQVQMQFAGVNSGTVTKGASILIQGVYPNNTTGTVTFTDYYGLRINNLLEWDTGTGLGKIAMTNKWAIYQAGVNDRNHFNGAVLIGTDAPTGEKLQVSGTMRVTGGVKLSGLPTSNAGLAAGDIWNDLGTLKIV